MTRNTNAYNTRHNLSIVYRIICAVTGTALIGSVLSHDQGGYLGWLSLLPIIAIYPCLLAITGFSPVRAGLNLAARRFRRWKTQHSIDDRYVDVFAY